MGHQGSQQHRLCSKHLCDDTVRPGLLPRPAQPLLSQQGKGEGGRHPGPNTHTHTSALLHFLSQTPGIAPSTLTVPLLSNALQLVQCLYSRYECRKIRHTICYLYLNVTISTLH